MHVSIHLFQTNPPHSFLFYPTNHNFHNFMQLLTNFHGGEKRLSKILSLVLHPNPFSQTHTHTHTHTHTCTQNFNVLKYSETILFHIGSKSQNIFFSTST